MSEPWTTPSKVKCSSFDTSGLSTCRRSSTDQSWALNSSTMDRLARVVCEKWPNPCTKHKSSEALQVLSSMILRALTQPLPRPTQILPTRASWTRYLYEALRKIKSVQIGVSRFLSCRETPGPRPPCTTKIFCSMRAARGSLFRALTLQHVQLDCGHDSYHALSSDSHIMPQIHTSTATMSQVDMLKIKLAKVPFKEWLEAIEYPSALFSTEGFGALVHLHLVAHKASRYMPMSVYDNLCSWYGYAHDYHDCSCTFMNSPRFRQALSKPKLPATDGYVHCGSGILVNMTCQLEAQPISPDQFTKQNYKLNLLITHLNLNMTTATC